MPSDDPQANPRTNRAGGFGYQAVEFAGIRCRRGIYRLTGRYQGAQVDMMVVQARDHSSAGRVQHGLATSTAQRRADLEDLPTIYPNLHSGLPADLGVMQEQRRTQGIATLSVLCSCTTSQ
jgi:hypothetical protein